jgi:protein-L-isoaspartate(D-aspartate) O-methyltransferase
MIDGEPSETPLKRLVFRLWDRGDIRSQKVKEAMLSVKREHFVPKMLKFESYIDRPLPIGKGQTISAPHMVAIMAEKMDALPGQKVLEIGTGSGYHAAVVSRLIRPGGEVFSIERIGSLVEFARRNIEKAGIENVVVIEGDGSVGLTEESPFDRIYYTCAAPDVPDMVMDQLSEDGILLAVEGPKYGTQRLIKYVKKSGKVRGETLNFCVFVPLIGELGY